MGRFAHYISFSFVWINILLTSAVRKDVCERCVKIDACPTFAHLNKHEQQVWLEQNPCEGQQATGRATVFGISSISTFDYICCPSNIWENINFEGKHSSLIIKRSVKPEEIQPNSNSGLEKLHHPKNKNQIISYPNDDSDRTQQLQSNNKIVYSADQNKPNNPNVYNNQQNGDNENVYGTYPNYQSVYSNPQNKGSGQVDYDNQQSSINTPSPHSIQQNRPIGQNLYGNEQNNEHSYGQNPNYMQYPTTSDNIWSIPGQQNVMNINPGQPQNAWQNFNAYPQQQNPYINNGNSNLFNKPNFNDQCANQISLLPDPQTKCCGQDMSGIDTITDLHNLLNMYAPSNSWSSRNTPQQHKPYQYRPLYPQKQKLSDNNDTVEITLDDRIAGGKETELDQFPWTVLLKTTFDYGNKQGVFSCGGSLISRHYVVTAGHCVFEQGARLVDLEITLAEYDKKTFPRDCKSEIGGKPKCIDNVLMLAENVILHPQYDDDNLHNDIALIKLHGYAPYTRYIRPICLPPINIDNEDLSNLPLAVAGWGRNGPFVSDIKQSTVVHLVPHDECLKSYPHLSTSHLCAAGRTGEDTCKGDSGGPLMMLFRGSYYVIGVVSGKRADSPCGTKVPSLYANVYQFVPWIKSVIKN